MLTKIQQRTGKQALMWLMENYARSVKENGSGDVISSNTMKKKH